ncbi:TPA: 30S ribosomal protein S13 [candidate division WWE3 bacterium]|uniref:Small ribosomal subunit protein uS13 n=1 Tax=candidate division WWE3 bacterium TaxID=2053526 RepID=A0A656PMT7_UNCKA|nr:Ribosomal protein S13 [candidate division WWE3 bacterium RAAC2_WWE3_1]KKS29093.1 MAG: Ribosomal protein S13 [candidate division WWE3 bacterium GW2011_GWB1_42_117]KKS55152.1 MAG: Ribosomal protein S13 [candidate division WWE3 bacterium GW2011_GWD2_42_34]KKT05702.1 MAG: Ribosomal protein S13 [candidate division WWE3 bacterium GW2011_GWE2_43_18]KKT07408.1 MAG: Ribosomal protein S13 [candidate division WWE3 bacterium GW2011_GWF2_43_18]KKT08214.1 MAG: Ribosomal protein S13 [candidate division WW
MPRIKGVDIPGEKRIEASLRYIYGIGPTISRKVLERSGINPDTRAKDLTDEDVAKINASIAAMELHVEGELKRLVNQNIRRLQEVKSYRGLRHLAGLPVRGQRTRTNSRTRKGKRKTVGGQKKKLAKK